MRVGIAGEQQRLEEAIATDHTAGEPPSRGSTILVNSGCTENSSSALRKIGAGVDDEDETVAPPDRRVGSRA